MPGEIPEKQEFEEQLDKNRNRLYDLQTKIKEHRLPVLVLFEGWAAAGKGSVIGKVIKILIPDSLRLQLWHLRQKRNFESLFCIVT